MMRLYSLKTKLLFLIFVSLALVGIFVSLGAFGYYYFQKVSYVATLKENLRSSAEIQSRAILLSYLIPEQKEGRPLLLAKYRKVEGLSQAEVIENDSLPRGFENCLLTTESTECLNQGKTALALIVPIQNGNKVYAYYFKSKLIGYDTIATSGYFTSFLWLLAVLLLTFLALFVTIARISSIEIPQTLNDITCWLERILQKKAVDVQFPSFRIKEVSCLMEKIRTIVAHHNEAKDKLAELERQSVFSSVARQVAHDIRSPLAALAVELTTLKELPEEKRLRVVRAINRINDIANDLLAKAFSSRPEAEDVNEFSLHLISSLTEALVSEKRIEFRSQLNKEIIFNLDWDSYGLFASISSKEYKRVLSNLIDNAIEALPETGTVLIKLYSEPGEIKINVQDNGQGIPKHLLPKLFQKGVSFGKKGGSGLGLYHAREKIEEWKGAIEIDSEGGLGTKVTLILPRQDPPDWFVPKITLYSKQTIIILDDDNTIHQIWEERFKEVSQEDIQIIHFSTCDKMVSWWRDLNARHNILSLIDYELLGESKNGLQVIEELGIKYNAILVTSHFENPKILKKCQELNVKLIPKGMAGFVPIELRTIDQSLEYILIDDNALVRSTWEQAASAKGKKMMVFESPYEFLNIMDDLSREVSIYIDSHFPEGLKGEQIAKEIYKKGFKSIYLTTGSDSSEFALMHWLKGVVGKIPPFLSINGDVLCVDKNRC